MLEMLCIEKNSISEEGMMHLASALNNHMVCNIFENTIEYLTFVGTKNVDPFSK